MRQLQVLARDLDPNWTWRTREGVYLTPHSMDTRHLFNVIKMIWNHTMPIHCTVGYVKWYDFQPSDFYTKRYMISAIYHIAWELSKRELENYQIEILDEMAMHLIQYPKIMEVDDEEEA